jgi:5-methylcytosine-specific restriction endonuclease McrA
MLASNAGRLASASEDEGRSDAHHSAKKLERPQCSTHALSFGTALKLGGECCRFAGVGTPGNPLHVDHIKPRSKFPRLAIDINNLQVLCADCNLGKRAGIKPTGGRHDERPAPLVPMLPDAPSRRARRHGAG